MASPSFLPRIAGIGWIVLLAGCPASSSSSFSGGSYAGSGGGDSTGGTGGMPSTSPCPPCVQNSDCAGELCAQFGGDSYCAPDCAASPCSSDRACVAVSSAEGQPAMVCVPVIDACGDGQIPGTGGASAGGAGGAGGAPIDSGTGGAPSDTCGVLDGPTVASCCHGCSAGSPCQANGCYNGWYCDRNACKCQPAPDLSTCSDAGTGGTGGSLPDNHGSVGATGGTLDYLQFAIVGDTRPAVIDDTPGYPSAIIKAIWTDLQNETPRPPFAITTGDYIFASLSGSEASPQIDKYLAARSLYASTVFYVMGNHECTGGTASNCGSGNEDGMTSNYKLFLSKMLALTGKQKPYYDFRVDATDHSWSAKFVVIAANAWDQTQATWLQSAMAKPTTYTFVIRHEPDYSNTAPGVTPSQTIVSAYPVTMWIAGHSHTLSYYSGKKEIIVGNGGAPLTGSVNYGYVLATQRADGSIEFRAKDYSSLATVRTFAVAADGTPQ